MSRAWDGVRQTRSLGDLKFLKDGNRDATRQDIKRTCNSRGCKKPWMAKRRGDLSREGPNQSAAKWSPQTITKAD